MQRLREFARQLPTFLTAFVLALAVWIIAVTASDPSEQKVYPSPVPIEIIGQSADLVITNQLPSSFLITLKAPASVWTSLLDEKAPVRAIIDLSGLGEGQHTVPIQIEIGVRPIEVIKYNPRSVDILLEQLASNQFDITVSTFGNPAIGYQMGTPQISASKATVSGAASLVTQVTEVKAQLDLTDLKSDFSQEVTLQAFDQYGAEVKGVSISPEKVEVKGTIQQLGGFRNVVVKVVTDGQVAMGYQLSSILVDPLTITVYSADPALVDALPGYVETDPINLSGLKDDLSQDVNLRLASGITVVGNPTVNVRVSINAEENSRALTDVTVEPVGLSSGLEAEISPSKVDLIIAGPLVSLNSVNTADIKVLIDLSGMNPGIYTFEPKTSLNFPDLRIENILPTTFEIIITRVSSTPTITPTK